MKEIIDLMGLDIEKVRDLLLGESIQCEILSGLLCKYFTRALMFVYTPEEVWRYSLFTSRLH